jgi:sulfate adenylyltransferase
MRLSSHIVWPMPIVLTANEQIKRSLNEGEEIALSLSGEVYGVLHLSEVYKINKEEAVEKILGTKDSAHPGVKRFMDYGDWFLGGKITLLKRRNSPYKVHELTPKQTRKIFSERGWSRVVGFHTRNVIHRGHEFIQLEAMKKGRCDGLFVHPVIGKKKKGDFEADIIIKSYEKMIEEYGLTVIDATLPINDQQKKVREIVLKKVKELKKFPKPFRYYSQLPLKDGEKKSAL